MLFRVVKRCCISKKYITRNCSKVYYAKEYQSGISSTPYVYSEKKATLDMRTIKTNPTVTVRYFDDRSTASFDYVFEVCEAEEPSTPTCGAQFL